MAGSRDLDCLLRMCGILLDTNYKLITEAVTNPLDESIEPN
jgi:hypothetical protein